MKKLLKSFENKKVKNTTEVKGGAFIRRGKVKKRTTIGY